MGFRFFAIRLAMSHGRMWKSLETLETLFPVDNVGQLVQLPATRVVHLCSEGSCTRSVWNCPRTSNAEHCSMTTNVADWRGDKLSNNHPYQCFYIGFQSIDHYRSEINLEWASAANLKECRCTVVHMVYDGFWLSGSRRVFFFRTWNA
jgi:hypothetical protein